MEFTIEMLDKALDHPCIKVEKKSSGKELFERWRHLEIRGRKYHIIWYCNLSYLHSGDLVIPFNFVRQSNTWPTHAKMNLQFYRPYSTVCCVLKIEDYKKDSKDG